MKKIAFLAAAVALLAMSTAAQAQNLPPGASLVPVPPGLETGTFVPGTDITLSGSLNTLSATVQESVYKETNGALDFVYQVTNSSAPGGDILERLTVSSYAGVSVNVEQSPTTAGSSFAVGSVPALTADRSASGAVVGFNFIPPLPSGNIPPGSTSYTLIVQTNATTLAPGQVSAINANTVTITGFLAPNPAGPLLGAPEPASLVLFGGLALGMGGAGLRRWRQRKAVSA